MPRKLSFEEAVGLLRPGWRVFLPGLASESALLFAALRQAPERCAGVTFCGALVPGINVDDYAALGPTTRQEVLFLSPHLAPSMAAGKIDQLPLGYWQAYRHYLHQAHDLVVVHVSAMQPDGTCSLGVNADFAMAALKGARATLAIVNVEMPVAGGPRLRFNDLNYYVDVRSSLPEFPEDATSDPLADKVAANAASLVEDGACIQYGIGRIPGRIVRRLADRRRLTMHSGLVTDDLLPLLDSGSIGRVHSHSRPVVTNAMVGTHRLYRLAGEDWVAFADVGFTHAPGNIAKLKRFVSINSAIEIDLLGQVNSEVVGQRPVSGVGGVGDFVRGANMAPAGRAIVALSSVTSRGETRIVPALRSGVPVSVQRSDAIIVVTENGIADLRGKTVRQRAEALIMVAAPEHRERLARAFFQ